MGFWKKSILYHSGSNENTLPREGWESVSGKEPAPTMKFPKPQYKLRTTDLPCEDVAPGQDTKDSSGSLVSPLCLKDVGDACIEPISKYSLFPSKLWSSTLEEQIKDKKQQVIRTGEKIVTREQQYEERARQLVNISSDDERLSAIIRLHGLVTTMKSDRAALQQLEADIPKLENTECWSGGKPDVGREVPRR